jgi:hypothetical protein
LIPNPTGWRRHEVFPQPPKARLTFQIGILPGCSTACPILIVNARMGLHIKGVCWFMEKSSDPVTSLRSNVQSLSRREWVQRMLAGAGAGLAAPTLAGAQPAHNRLVSIAGTAAAPAEASADWTPEFLSDDQVQALTAMAERIVPGSTHAQVTRFLDMAVAAETAEIQQKFVTSINALEGQSLQMFSKSFQSLSPEQQDQVLTAASTAAPSDLRFAETTAGGDTGTPAPNIRDYFEYLKGWVSMGYYSSEIGMKELGWTGENFFPSFPGCEHPGGHS